MTNFCLSCGGILGRDCFNPVECAQITASMNQPDTYYDLERAIHILKQLLIEHNIPLPDLGISNNEPATMYHNDELPF